MFRYGTASLVEPGIDTDKWIDQAYKTACSDGHCRLKTARSIIAKYDPRKYLLSHCSIIAAVDTDLADPANPKSDYLIKPEYSRFVNNNGDAWTKRMLEACYRSFIGSNNYCFPAGTRVLMADGRYKNIEDIVCGDRVINRKGEIGKVSNVFHRQVNELIEIKSRGILSRSLFTTKEHPFWIFSARKTCPKTNRPNTFNPNHLSVHLKDWIGFAYGVHLAKNENYPCGILPRWEKAQNIDPMRDFLTHPITSKEIVTDDINKNRAELLGWYLAEGFIGHKNSFSSKVSDVTFALGNKEMGIAERLSDLLTIEFGKYFRVDCKPRIYETESGSINLTLCNEEAALFFEKWGNQHSWEKKMPEEALWLPKELQAIILKSCIQGDGCGTITSRGYTIEIKSQSLIQQFLLIAWRLGLSPTYKETGVRPRYSQCEMTNGYPIFIDPITNKKSRPGYMLRFSTRDSKTLNALINVQDERISSRKSKRLTNVFETDDGSWILSKIDSVKPTSVSCDVYNIEVEDDNSYVVEGVVVHNCEHVQIPALSKGKVIDAVLREIPIGKDTAGKDVTTYYVDILVATDRKHTDLIRKIESGETSKLSMGCLITFSVCSKCGNRAVDETQACSCVKYEKNNYFYDQNGVRRRVAELCGHFSEPESVRFIDASWVKNPAFTGAVLRNVVDVPSDIMAKIENANKVESFVPKGGEFIKAAADELASLIAQDSPREKEETPPKEIPAEGEAPAEETPPEGAAPETPPEEGLGEIPAEGAPGAEEAPAAEGPEELTELTPEAIRKWKTTLKKNLLNELGKEISETLTKPEEEPQELETLDESIIKPANVVLRKMWSAKRSWDHYLKQTTGKLSSKNFNKLRYGTYILLTSNDSRTLADYGYTKRDFLAVLSYLDGCSKNPLPITIKKVLAELGGTNKSGPVDLLKQIVGAIGRKVSKEEARRSLIWLKMMDAYDSKGYVVGRTPLVRVRELQ